MNEVKIDLNETEIDMILSGLYTEDKKYYGIKEIEELIIKLIKSKHLITYDL